MITFSEFQSLGEEEKLNLLLKYIDTYEISEVAAHWHMETKDVFDIQMNLIRRKEGYEKEEIINPDNMLSEKNRNLLSYDEIQALPPTEKAELMMKYHEMYEGKVGLLASELGVGTKKMYNLIYQSRQRLRGLNEKRVDGSMTKSKDHNHYESDNSEKIDQLYLSTNIIEEEITVELNGEGNGNRIAKMLRSIAILLEEENEGLMIDLKVKRFE